MHFYVPYLSLILIDAVCEINFKKVVKNQLIFNFLRLTQFVHNYIKNSTMRHSTLEEIAIEIGITRWEGLAEAVKAIINN